MSKKKLICILLALVLVFSSLLSACAMFEEDTYLSSNETAFTVGDQKISVGTFLSAYTSLYNTYYYYIYYGYMTEADLINYAYTQLVYTNTFLNEYKKVADAQGNTYDHKYVSVFKDSKYLSAEDIEYVLKYSKYAIYSAIDELVKTSLSEKHVFLEEETTSRDMLIKKLLESISADAFNLVDEEVEKYLLNAPGGLDYTNFDTDYVFSVNTTDEAELAKIQARLDSLNKQLDVSDADYQPITKEEYIKAQKEALTNFRSTVKSNYGVSVDKFVVMQVEETINNSLVTLFQKELSFKTVEQDKEALFARLNTLWQSKKQAAIDKYLIDPAAWATDIEALSNTAFIYALSPNYNYVFVKNILIPFSDAQTAELDALQEEIDGLNEELDDASGATEIAVLKAQIAQREEELKNYRLTLAAQILAKDYVDESQNYKSFFTVAEGKLTVNTSSDLYKGFTDSKGNAVKGLKNIASAQDFKDLMERYNVDVAQHSSYYDYVVNVTPDEGYTAKWVTEFVEGAKEAVFGSDEENPAQIGENIGNWSVAVTQYGVHIIYYSGDIAVQTPDFSAKNAEGILKIYDTTTIEYRFMSVYFNEVYSAYLTEERAEMLKNTIIKLRPYIKKIVKNYDVTLPTFDK